MAARRLLACKYMGNKERRRETILVSLQALWELGAFHRTFFPSAFASRDSRKTVRDIDSMG